MDAPTARQTYRDLVAEVAAKAKAKLPLAVNGRIEKATRLVLMGDVEPQDDGSIVVFSATDATRRYVLQGVTCTCADYERGQAPDGWCAHRIAAGIDKRVRELLPQSPGMETQPEVSSDYHYQPPQPTGQPLPEAPASVNVRIQVAGRDVQLTLRDTDEVRLLARLEEVLQRYPAPQPPAPPADPTPQCPQHGALKKSTKGKGWYCPHKLADGSWCKAKAQD